MVMVLSAGCKLPVAPSSHHRPPSGTGGLQLTHRESPRRRSPGPRSLPASPRCPRCHQSGASKTCSLNFEFGMNLDAAEQICRQLPRAALCPLPFCERLSKSVSVASLGLSTCFLALHRFELITHLADGPLRLPLPPRCHRCSHRCSHRHCRRLRHRRTLHTAHKLSGAGGLKSIFETPQFPAFQLLKHCMQATQRLHTCGRCACQGAVSIQSCRIEPASQPIQRLRLRTIAATTVALLRCWCGMVWAQSSSARPFVAARSSLHVQPRQASVQCGAAKGKGGPHHRQCRRLRR